MTIIVQYTLVFATVLALVALGGMFAEHSGVINLGLEGTMVIGALGGALAMRYLPSTLPSFLIVVLVILISILCGVIYSLLLGLACITFKADQTITGTALNILAPALATVVVKAITLNEDGKATSQLQYINMQENFVFNLTKTDMSWVIPAILIIAGLIVLFMAFKGIKNISKKVKIEFIVGGCLTLIGVVFAILFGLGILPMITFEWALFIILILYALFKTYLLVFKKDKVKFKKNLISAIVFGCLAILILVLNLTGFFVDLTMNWFVPLMLVLVCISVYVLYSTKFGLRLLSCGENPQAADAVGINVNKTRYIGVIISGCFAGIGGLAFIASVNSSWTFDVGVSGFGFLALAVMIFGQWKPINILLGAVLFGFFRAIGLTYVNIPFLQDMNISSSWYSMLPYVVCLIVLAFTSRKSRAPKAEGVPYDKGSRG